MNKDILQEAKKIYKTDRKYKCPYCDKKLDRNTLIDHIDKEHDSLIPQGYTAERVVYEAINKTDHGVCMICKKPVYEWNDKLCRYNNLCNNKSCRDEVRLIALERHVKVYNKPTLLDDPNHQEKMLERRRISGKYTFKDGGKITFTGTYERKTLEFMDQVLNIKSYEIQAPGPVLEYEYNGERHFWITDIYYIPANLVIEVKDGGSNPNNRTMTVYREKQDAKESMITSLGTLHYLRLTNNNFEQLLDILADIKMGYMDGEDPLNIRTRINEYMAMGGANPVVGMKGSMLVVPYMLKNSFDTSLDGIAYLRPDDSDVKVCDKNGIHKEDRSFLSDKEYRILKLEINQSIISNFMMILSSININEDAMYYSLNKLGSMLKMKVNEPADLLLKEFATVIDSRSNVLQGQVMDRYRKVISDSSNNTIKIGLKELREALI